MKEACDAMMQHLINMNKAVDGTLQLVMVKADHLTEITTGADKQLGDLKSKTKLLMDFCSNMENKIASLTSLMNGKETTQVGEGQGILHGSEGALTPAITETAPSSRNQEEIVTIDPMSEAQDVTSSRSLISDYGMDGSQDIKEDVSTRSEESGLQDQTRESKAVEKEMDALQQANEGPDTTTKTTFSKDAATTLTEKQQLHEAGPSFEAVLPDTLKEEDPEALFMKDPEGREKVEELSTSSETMKRNFEHQDSQREINEALWPSTSQAAKEYAEPKRSQVPQEYIANVQNSFEQGLAESNSSLGGSNGCETHPLSRQSVDSANQEPTTLNQRGQSSSYAEGINGSTDKNAEDGFAGDKTFSQETTWADTAEGTLWNDSFDR